MGLWCGRMTAGGWVLMTAIWAALIAVTLWAVCRLFPVRRTPDPRAARPDAAASPHANGDGPAA